MKVTLDKKNNTVAIELDISKDYYYLSTYQARWHLKEDPEGLTGARTSLHLSSDTAKELKEKLAEALNGD